VNMKTITELNFICTFKLSQDSLENFFSSIRMSSGLANNPTMIQFKAAFESLLCNCLNRKDNGNSIFDDTISIPESAEVCCDIDVPIFDTSSNDRFLDNVMIYISGFIMRTLILKEKCT